MNELPQWMVTAIISVIVAGITFFASRRLNSATVAEKDANALKIMSDVADSLARQLRMIESEVPGWKKGMADATTRAEMAERKARYSALIAVEARNMVDQSDHMSYRAMPGEVEDPLEPRFRSMKASSVRIKELLNG